jgi:hypothetical protein
MEPAGNLVVEKESSDRASHILLIAPVVPSQEVRRNMHVVLSFSPVGDAFRERLRKFPSLVNCTTIDW